MRDPPPHTGDGKVNVVSFSGVSPFATKEGQYAGDG